MTRPAAASRLFPTLLAASLAAHVSLPFVIGSGSDEVPIVKRRPRTPMTVRLVAPPVVEAQLAAVERVLTADSARRAVETLDLPSTEFERPEREASAPERMRSDQAGSDVAERAVPRELATAARDEAPAPGARITPQRSERARVDVELETPSASTELVSGVLDYDDVVVDGNPPPEYPWRAQQRRQEGTCVLLIRVTREGRVAEVRVEQSSGHHLLDDAAVEAARERWRFPSRSAAYAVRKPVTFQLQR